jgi:immune inhibitor A
VWTLISHAAARWVQDKLAAGATMDQIKAELATYDVEDRYDADGDGNFNEPDGYLDHFQLNHAGADEAVGGGAEGEYAIWSHRWYAFYNNIGVTGPPNAQLGGVQIGVSSSLGLNNPTGFWIGDYLMNPENGGVGVIAHETGHDYGLPDEYDTTYTGESSAAFWTLMASGSYGGDGSNGIGNWPIHFNAWDKFQLGWLNYEVARAGQKSEHMLGPEEYNTKQAQGLFVVLPKKTVTVNLGAPFAGSKFYYSGAADNLNTAMTRSVTLPAGTASVAAKVRFNIEKGYDFAFLSVNGTKVATNLSNSTVDPKGIEGVSNGWVDLTADLSAYAGQTVSLAFGYFTDGGVQGADPTLPAGFSIDEIAISGQATDGAETDAGWTFSGGGFRVTSGTESALYNHYYVVENRQYLGADDSLRTGPYNFGFLNTKPDWVEKFPYQDGVLVSYWDTATPDNDVGQHPGAGQILPIDAHQSLVMLDNGTPARTRIQVYDATLSTEPTDAITLHRNGVAYSKASEPGISVFDDSQSYWNSAKPDTGVKVPNTGTTIRLQSMNSTGFAQVQVAPK